MGEAPWPGRSSATQRCVRMKCAIVSSQLCQFAPQPWMNTSGGPESARVEHVDALAQELHRPLQRRPVDVEPGRVVAVGVRRVRPRPADCVAQGRRDLWACRRHVASTVSTAVKLAIDIDSTLHHYWDQLSDAARRRFGIALPYDDQLTWQITLLRPEQVRACVEETHTEARVLAAEPYPGAVDVVRRWHGAGHWIQVTSHRAVASQEATARWLDQIGLPHDELYCSYDKVARCRELGVDVLIDDSPVNLEQALDAGILAATIAHPWNRELCETEDVICAPDWPELERRLAPVLAS